MSAHDLESKMSKVNNQLIARRQQGVSPCMIEFNGRPELLVVKWQVLDNRRDIAYRKERLFKRFNLLPLLAGSHVVTGLFGERLHDSDFNKVPYIVISTPEEQMYAFPALSAEQLNGLGALATLDPDYHEFTADDLVVQKFPKIEK